MNTPGPRVRAFEQPTGSFGKSVKRLSKPMKQELAIVMDELLSGMLSPGRRYEKLTVGEDLHSVRMSRKYRFVFQILNTGNAKPVAVGPHDEAYRRARSLGT
jgi:plasmid maintenance system killer protein